MRNEINVIFCEVDTVLLKKVWYNNRICDVFWGNVTGIRLEGEVIGTYKYETTGTYAILSQ